MSLDQDLPNPRPSGGDETSGGGQGGAPLITTCPTCATPLVPGARFCHHCGRPLAHPQPDPGQARLQKYIPRELLAKLEAARLSAARHAGDDIRSLSGERRIVTILFCDVTGSTSLAETLDPEEWAEVMNGAFEYLIKPVYRYEGLVARLMGDAILAFFGAPIAHEDDAQRAVRAGLDILEGIGNYRARILRERGLDFDVRVGIHTGLVVVGEVGSDLRVEYTAMGDAVNLAARLEQAAKPGSVQISGDTYRLIAPFFEVEALGDIAVKGRRQPVAAYRVSRSTAAHAPLRGIAGLESPLIGREKELAMLQRVLSELQEGHGQIVCLIGEAGLGKSRLIGELRAEWLAAQGGRERLSAALQSQQGGRLHSWIEGRCLSYESTRPYRQLQHLVRDVCGATETDSPDVVREKIARLSGSVPFEQRTRLSQVFEVLLAVDADSDRRSLEGEALKRQLFGVVWDTLRAWAWVGPGVLAFDDLHWCDPASVELLLRLFQLVDDAPILFLCAVRPDWHSPAAQIRRVAASDFLHRYTEIVLAPLSIDESNRLLDGLVPLADFPPQLRKRILQTAEGNPFFVEEVVRALMDHGALVREEREGVARWRVAPRIEGLTIPDSLQALLMARMDRLDESVRRTLQLAAVIGRTFSRRILELMSDAATELDQHLASLQQVDLIREEVGVPDIAYTFRHALTQEAAYQSILLRRRRELHRQVGDTLETLFPNRLEEQAALLAYHFDAAGDPRAPTYHSLAADAAFRLYATAEADAHYTRAVELIRRVGTDADYDGLWLQHLYTRRGRVLELSGRYDDAIANYEEMETAAHRRGDRQLELAALVAHTTVHSRFTAKYDPEHGQALAARGLALARELGDRPAEANILSNLLVLHTFTGQLVEASEYGEQSLAIARELDLRAQLAHTLDDLSRVYMHTGQVERMHSAQQEAGDLWRASGDVPRLAENLANAATGHLFFGEYEQAVRIAYEALRISRSIDDRWGQAYSREVAGLVHMEWGQADDAIAALQEAIQLGEQSGFFDAIVSARAYLGLIYAHLGDIGRGLELARLAVARAEPVPSVQATPLAMLASLHVLKGDLAEAGSLIQEAQLKLSPNLFSSYAFIWVMFADAELAIASRDYARAEDLMNNLLSLLRPAQARPFILNALSLTGRALMGSGKSDEAREHLAEALDMADVLGSRRTLLSVLIDLSQLEARCGNLAEAERLGRQARRTIEYTAGHIGVPELRAAFLNLPHVRAILPTG